MFASPLSIRSIGFARHAAMATAAETIRAFPSTGLSRKKIF